LFEKYGSSNYKNWVKTIQKGGYAHSRTWGSQVLAIINKYHLYEYDSTENKQLAYESRPMILIEANQITEPVTYRVKSGDTLSSIAKEHKTTVEALKAKNMLKSSFLKLGQELII